MKKFSFFALATVGLLLGACSSDSEVTPGSKGNSWNGDDKGYIGLSINLPTTPSTRAANDVYDDGLADEYRVEDAGLLLFKGADEATATLMSAQPIVLPFDATDEDADNDNLTTVYQTVAEVNGTIDASENLYGLVVLNYKNVLSITGGTAQILLGTPVTVTDLASLNTTLANVVVGTTENNVPTTASNKKFTNKSTNEKSNYFFMTNAVLQYADGTAKAAAPTAAQIKTLAELDKSKIYRTEAEAKANPAGTIYVERAVAKATLSATATTIESGATPLNITSVEWAIDNIEPTSFVVRNPGDNAYIAYSSEAFTTPVYRMVGDVKMGTTPKLHNYQADIYRHYWCQDPQYSATATGLVAAKAYGPTGITNPQYCNENTFNVVNQTYQNTTRAVIKVTTDGGDFYTVNNNEERYTETAAKSYIIKDLVENSSFQAKIKGCLLGGHSYTFSETTIVPTWEVDPATAQVKIASITLNSTEITSTDFDMTAIAALGFTTEINDANANFKVLKYTGGVVYYEARFEHFANTAYEKGLGTFDAATAKSQGDLAPWNCWETTKPTATVAYPNNTKSAEENYLGRYGMVRNNWYDVRITAFNKLGSPVDPSGKIDKPSTPDDNVLAYISVKIAVLSWARRTQSWSF